MVLRKDCDAQAKEIEDLKESNESMHDGKKFL